MMIQNSTSNTTATKPAYRPPADTQSSQTTPANARLIRWKEVHSLTSICRSHAHAMAARGEFPTPIKLGSRASAWIEAEVLQWVQDRIDASRSASKQEGAE